MYLKESYFVLLKITSISFDVVFRNFKFFSYEIKNERPNEDEKYECKISIVKEPNDKL